MKFTDKDIDSLLATVEASLVKAETLAKAFPDKKDDAPPADAPPADAPPMGAAPSAPPADMPPADAPPAPAADAPADMPPADAPPADAPPAEGQAPEGQPSPDQQLEGEGQEAPLSDEELDQIYGSLDPQELERHYMAIRKHLQGAYAKAEMESEKKEDKEDKEEDKKDEEDKVEKSEVVELKKKNAEMEKTLESLTKAIELLAQPKRKAVTSVGNLGKSEDAPKLTTKAEVKARLTELTKSASLSKSERESINSYCLHGNSEKEIVSIIQKFEGSK